MSDTHPLKALLTFQLATETSAALHLPYILQVITPDSFKSSPHLSKWLLRVNSLLHSKETSAKWTGLCLAHATSLHSKPSMIENAQSWLQVALPMLSRKEPPALLKAAVNLCRIIFAAAADTPEFQRQVSTPNVPKFTTALIQRIDDPAEDMELKVLALRTITRLVPIYPNIHRASYAQLSTLSLKILFDTHHLSSKILGAPAAELYSVLHLTGGKVGAATLWRKSLDERLADAWTAFGGLRTSFPDGQENPEAALDPSISVSLNLTRLNASILILCQLLKAPTSRPVQVPIGPLVKFAITLLAVSKDEQVDENTPIALRALEAAAIPSVHEFACEFTSCLARCAKDHLNPYLPRFCTCIASHLEQKPEPTERLRFLQALEVLFTSCRSPSSSVVLTRLTRAVLSVVSLILPSQGEAGNSSGEQGGGSKSKKGKKRARGYEGDEVFNASISVICPSVVEGKVLLTACDVLQVLIQNPEVSTAMHSLSCRVVLAAMLSLPQLSPALVSPDIQVYHQVIKRLQTLALNLSEGTTSAMGRSLGLVMRALSTAEINTATVHNLDVLLHPRLPPLLRSLPPVEALALFRHEEGEEEAVDRQWLGIAIHHDAGEELPAPIPITRDEDTIMRDVQPTETTRQVLSTDIARASSTSLPAPAHIPTSAPVPQPPVIIPHVKPTPPRVRTPSVQVSLPAETSQNSTPASVGIQPQKVSPSPTEIPAPSTLVPETHEDEEMPSIDVDSDSESEE